MSARQTVNDRIREIDVVETETQAHVFLHQGQIYCTGEPTVISTVLGSCVSVCLWDPVQVAGGMNHFVLPGEAGSSGRYGDAAIDRLVEEMLQFGCRAENIEAKLFGGGSVLPIAGSAAAIGSRNADSALARLARWKLKVVARDIGGTYGRFLRFDTATGVAMMRRLAKAGIAADAVSRPNAA